MIVIKTSSDNKQILEKIALKLLNQKVAGCVNLFPACISYFVWDNKINKSKENLLFIKTIKKNEGKAYEIIQNMHNYDTPEIITLTVENVEKHYKRWLMKETKTNA